MQKQEGKVLKYLIWSGKEFALARIENKNGVGHKAFEIRTGKDISIEEDLARRDLTINSIARDVLTGEIIDPFNGIQDLKDKILRATTEKFKEDPLRVYRVARMAATYEFSVEERTIEYMNQLKNELASLSAERVFNEFRKALNSNKPSIFFETLKKAGVLEEHFIEIFKLIGVEQPKVYHPEGDAYNHTMQVIDKASNLTTNEIIRYSALVHDLGKGVTPKEKYPHHYGHDKMGIEQVSLMSNRLKVPTMWKKAGKIAAEEHMRAGIFNQMKTEKQVDLLVKLKKSPLGLEGMEIVVTADRWRGEYKPKISNFVKIGEELLNTINGDFIIKKYGKIEGERFNKLLREERISYLKKNF